MLNRDTTPPSLLLRNVRIVTTGRVVERGSVMVTNGRIARLADSHSSEKLRADSELDLSGLTLFPGFVDVHIHGAIGIDTMAATAEDLGSVSEYLARHGVTAWLPTLVPSEREQYESAINAIEMVMREQEQTESARSRLLGVHYEGPFVNAEQCGALHRERFRDYQDAAHLEGLPTLSNRNAIHMMTMAPEVAGGIELIKELKRRGWVVSIGHTRAGPEILDQAFAAGARHLTHFMNAMPPLHQRAPGPVGWGLTRHDVSCDVIADGIHVDPLVLKLLVDNKTPEKLSLISDAIAPTGLKNGEYQVWGETIAVENGHTRNSRGRIAGSVITMLDAVCMMLSLGVTEPDVVRMASLNPARLLGIDGDCGSIEEGKRADLVALDQSQRVNLTIIGGRVISD